MAVVTSIVDAICERAAEVGASRVVNLTLFVGELRDIHEPLLQRYFDYFSKGTPAEGVKVDVVTIPLRYRCDECGCIYGYDLAHERVIPLDANFVSCRDDSVSVGGASMKNQANDSVPAETGQFDAQSPYCLNHPSASITIVSGTELFIEDIGVM